MRMYHTVNARKNLIQRFMFKIKKLVTLKKDDIHFLFFLFAIGTLSNSEPWGGEYRGSAIGEDI